MKVRELLSDESKWVQGIDAVDCLGMGCSPYSDQASKWCLMGAIAKCYDYSLEDRIEVNRVVRSWLLNNNGVRSVSHFNDTHSYADVKTLVEELDI
jgi:hypothetical protein